MSRTRILLLLLACFIYTRASSQTIKVGFQSGLGTYRMQELEKVTSLVYEGLPFKAAVLASYPSWLYYKPELWFSLHRFNLGINASFCSSGSRISSKDYSGEYLFNTKVKSFAPGIYADYFVYSLKGKYNVSVFSEGGVLLSKMTLKETLTVNSTEILNTSYTFKSLNYFAEPGIKLAYDLNRNISFELSAGYLVQFGRSDFKTDRDEIFNFNHHEIGPGWSGFRFGLGILYQFPGKSDTKLVVLKDGS
jgi:hypothetical protein